MPSDRDCINCFKMPSGMTITGRASSTRNVFAAAILPVDAPSAEEVRQVLAILHADPANLQCAYCGSSATEWDHLRPLVNDGKPTGYTSTIRNLVPSCGKCNQSKGKSDWKTWMQSNARLSPKSRGVKDLVDRISRLEQYEGWANCYPIQVEGLISPELWDRYYKLQDEILAKMREAQALASEIAKHLRIGTDAKSTSAQ